MVCPIPYGDHNEREDVHSVNVFKAFPRATLVSRTHLKPSIQSLRPIERCLWPALTVYAGHGSLATPLCMATMHRRSVRVGAELMV